MYDHFHDTHGAGATGGYQPAIKGRHKLQGVMSSERAASAMRQGQEV